MAGSRYSVGQGLSYQWTQTYQKRGNFILVWKPWCEVNYTNLAN